MISVTDQKARFVALMILTKQFAKMPTSQDQVIFFVDDDNEDGQTNHFTPCACTHGNNYVTQCR